MDNLLGVEIHESKFVPDGVALLVTPSRLVVPEGLTVEQVAELVVVDLVTNKKSWLISWRG